MIERQVRNWEIARQQKLEAQARAARPVEEFIAVSWAVGLDAAGVAEALHQRMGWPVFDRQIVQAMAGDDDYRRRLYATMDERDLSWLEECLRSMGENKYAKNDYYHRLRETVLSLARKGHAIFIGHAADLILPRIVGLRVRLTAGRAFCVRQYAEANKQSAENAERELKKLEDERTQFVAHHFGLAGSDPGRYDLTINLERLSARQAVEVILATMRIRGLGP
jgi:cytidylate kinase